MCAVAPVSLTAWYTMGAGRMRDWAGGQDSAACVENTRVHSSHPARLHSRAEMRAQGKPQTAATMPHHLLLGCFASELLLSLNTGAHMHVCREARPDKRAAVPTYSQHTHFARDYIEAVLAEVVEALAPPISAGVRHCRGLPGASFRGFSWSTGLDWIVEAGDPGPCRPHAACYACCAESHPSTQTQAVLVGVPLVPSSHMIPHLCMQTGCEVCKTCGSLLASTCDGSPPHAAAVMVACARHAPLSPACCRLPVTPTSPPLPSRPATSGPRRLLQGSGSAGKGRLIPQQQQQQQQQRYHCR